MTTKKKIALKKIRAGLVGLDDPRAGLVGLDDPRAKKEAAIDFLNQLRVSSGRKVDQIVHNELGADLADFMVEYSVGQMVKSNSKRNTASLFMILGYLIRVSESKSLLIKRLPKGEKPQ